jgi:hypothetical protein
VAVVFEPAAFAVSAIRITSPPTLLGRKLLKNVATRNDSNSFDRGSLTPCAPSRSCQRHALTPTPNRYSASAAPIQMGSAPRSPCATRPTSARRNNRVSSVALTAIFSTTSNA